MGDVSVMRVPPPHRIWTRLRGLGLGLEWRILWPTAFDGGMRRAWLVLLFCQGVTSLGVL